MRSSCMRCKRLVAVGGGDGGGGGGRHGRQGRDLGTVFMLAAATRVDAAELEREDRPEKMASKLEATATVASATGREHHGVN